MDCATIAAPAVPAPVIEPALPGGPPVPARPIVARTRGRAHGPITRLVSPQGMGERIKPFVFLDYFEGEPGRLNGFGWHPHSGIATVTVPLAGRISYDDSTGEQGTLETGDVEWMQAGGGVWHTGRPLGSARVAGYQLWLALGPDRESAPARSRYLRGGYVPSVGPARVILGRLHGVASPVPAPEGIDYLHVTLAAGQSWSYVPAPGQTVAWLAVQQGRLRAAEAVGAGELVVFAATTAPVSVTADSDVVFVFGSAVPHPHPLVLGDYSVHTSAPALEHGEAQIRRIGAQLQVRGTS